MDDLEYGRVLELLARSILGSQGHRYLALPKAVRRELTETDYANFLERLREGTPESLDHDQRYNR